MRKEMRRERHKKILRILESLDSNLFVSSSCFFGGGTAISFLLNEYRESVDVDFLCSDKAGYAKIRSLVNQSSISNIFSRKDDSITLPSDVRLEREAIRARIIVDGEPIKFEIIRAYNAELSGDIFDLPVPVLSKESLFAEKLMANIDRWQNVSGQSKDVVDLIMMSHHWGGPPDSSIKAAVEAYNLDPMIYFEKAIAKLKANALSFNKIMDALKVNTADRDIIFNYELPEVCQNKISKKWTSP